MKTGTLNSKDVNVSMRIDGSFHLSAGVIIEREIVKHSHKPLIDFCSSIFTSGRSKRVYTKKEYGYPYLSNSDVVAQNSFDSCNHNSRKYGYDESAFLKEGMVLTGRVGAIGQTAYVTKEFEEKKAMGSDNIIRIVAKSSEYSGYIYSFLSSKIGNTLLWKLAAGGVQPYITDQMVKNIPVPLFPESKQQEIHNLIVESASLRMEANKLLEEAKALLENEVNANYQKQSFKISCNNIKDIFSSLQCRLDPPAIISDGVQAINKLKSKGIIFRELTECNTYVYRPGIFKRSYVKMGYPYIKGSELFDNNHFLRCQYLSKTKTPFVKEMLLRENQILITCAGSCGQVKLITKEFEDKGAIGSQDIIRVEAKDSLFTAEYLFIYFQLPFVFDYIQSMKYGSVIERIEPFHVGSIPVFIPSEKVSQEITDKINVYKKNMYIAFNKENQAISLVEKEIESWQQS